MRNWIRKLAARLREPVVVSLPLNWSGDAHAVAEQIAAAIRAGQRPRNNA